MTIIEAMKSGCCVRRLVWDHYLQASPDGELAMANGGSYMLSVSDLLADDWETVPFVYRVSRGPSTKATVYETTSATEAAEIVCNLIQSTPHGMGLYVRVDL